MAEVQLGVSEMDSIINNSQARSSSPASPRLRAVLHSLSLAQYLEPLVSYGIDSWDLLVDIQEHDLETLNFKLGHRRKLQREIAVSKNTLRLQEQLQNDHGLRPVNTDPVFTSMEKRRHDQSVPTQGNTKRSVVI